MLSSKRLFAVLITVLQLTGLHAETNKWSRTGPIGRPISISNIVVDPKNSNTILAAFWNGGVLRSIDGGATWTAADSGTVPVWVNSLVMDPHNSNIVYAADYDGVFKSVDGGLTWSALETSQLAGCWSIVIDPRNSDILWAATPGDGDSGCCTGIYRSTDAGNTWQGVLTSFQRYAQPTGSFYQLAIDPRNSDTILAGGGTSYRSFDGGKTWEPIGVGSFGGWLGNVTAMVMDPNNPDIVYVGTGNGLLKSTDLGTSWSAIASLTVGVYKIVLDPNTDTIYVGTRAGIFKSTDGAASWTLIYSEVVPAPLAVGALAMDPTNSKTLYAGTVRGISKTGSAGLLWSEISINVAASNVTALALDPGDPAAVYMASDNKVFKRSSPKQDWIDMTGNLTAAGISAIAVDPEDSSIVYVATKDGVFKTFDGGATWSSFSTDLPVGSILPVGWMRALLVVDPENPSTVFAGIGSVFSQCPSGALFKTMDGGLSWRSVTRSRALDGAQLCAVALDPRNSHTIYIGADRGLFKSIDGGETWQPLPAVRLDRGIAGFVSVAVDPLRPDTLYAGTLYDFGIRKSTDGGSTWARVNNGLSWSWQGNSYLPEVRFLAINPENPDIVYAGTHQGVFKSVNGGNRWEPITSGMPARYVTSLTIDPANPNHVYAGTLGGLFEITFDSE
jgi:photosystem II stability/assembly factor-like uncharacterized protein